VDLVSRLVWLAALSILLTTCSIIAAFLRRRVKLLYQFNSSLLAFFGVEPNHPLSLRLVAGWLVTSGIATLLLVLSVNLVDTVLLLTGQSGIVVDFSGVTVLVGIAIASIILILPALLPVLAQPSSSPTAFAILVALHLFGFHYAPGLPYDLAAALVVGSTFLFFCAVSVGVVGATLSIYLLFRSYLVPAVLHRHR
jgi:hypothetical protein